MGPYLAQPNTEKHTNSGQSLKNKIRFSLCDMQGWRRCMEDSAITQADIGNGNSLFAVFDGHGGLEVAKYVERIFLTQLKASKAYKEERYKDALIDTFRKVDQMIQSKEGEDELKIIRKKFDAASNSDAMVVSMGTGCTANVILITSTKIFTANAGDSRSVLCHKGTAVPLSFDHKPENEIEKNRINSAGGQIINGRVNGGLNLSRSFGDFNYKQNKGKSYEQQMIISRPDVTERARSPGGDQFIIAGCDGIWERYINDSQPLVTRLWNQRKVKTDARTIMENLLDSLLAKSVSEEIGCDNMTALLIQFL